MNAMSQTPSTDDVNRKDGCVLILSNQLPDGVRFHSEYAEMMKKVWNEDLRCKLFEDRIHLDKSCEDMIQIFDRLGKSEEAFGYDYLVVVIIARGGLIQSPDKIFSPHILGSDMKVLPEDRMFSSFRNDKSTWQGKQKLFILGYPRYRILQIREYDSSSGHIVNDDPSPQPEWSWNERNIVSSIVDPITSDILRVYGEPSTRLITEINEIFSKSWEDDPPVFKLFTMVNDRMIKNLNCFSVYESTLTDALHLFSRDAMLQAETGKHEAKEFFQQQNKNKSSDTSREEMIHANLKLHEDMKKYNMATNEKQFAEAKQDMTNELNEIRDRKPRKGCVLIMSNPLCDKSTYHEKDIQMMVTLWKDVLHCELVGDEAHTNQTAEMMRTRLENLSKMKNLDQYDYVVVVISSHGFMSKKDSGDGSYIPNRQYFQGCDRNPVDESTILSMFNDPSCEWRDKAKIFLLDYCRGRNEDYGIPAAKEIPMNQLDIAEDILPPYILPVIKESFIVYSTHYDYIAMANRLTFHISDVFTKFWNERSVASMLTIVNKKVKITDVTIKTMSIFKSTVTTDFHLYQDQGSSPKN